MFVPMYSDGDVSSGNYEGEGEGIVGYLPKAASFMPDADLDASVWTRTRTVKDQELEGSLCDCQVYKT